VQRGGGTLNVQYVVQMICSGLFWWCREGPGLVADDLDVYRLRRSLMTEPQTGWETGTKVLDEV
jgi:hypothetical protein